MELTSIVKNAKLYLITSSHGANPGGEEYNRRDHYIYFDNKLLSVYLPGGKSCEPFRIYNTQRNGIYGTSARTDAEWISFSNWCPGDVIPIRVYHLGDLEKRKYTFRIEVPDAKFVGKQGEIPLSAYIQGDKEL
ncbi:MAG: peptide-N-glycosidase F-related protein [Bacteroidota bacterium]